MPSATPMSSDGRDLRARISEVFEAQWMPEGYTAPNNVVYPWQWLWDSCFHAVIVWLELGEDERQCANSRTRCRHKTKRAGSFRT